MIAIVAPKSEDINFLCNPRARGTSSSVISQLTSRSTNYSSNESYMAIRVPALGRSPFPWKGMDRKRMLPGVEATICAKSSSKDRGRMRTKDVPVRMKQPRKRKNRNRRGELENIQSQMSTDRSKRRCERKSRTGNVPTYDFIIIIIFAD